MSSFPTNDFKFHQWSLYAQDSFKANRQLTLNYGLRFDHVGQWYGTSQGIQVWNPAAISKMSMGPVDLYSALHNTGLQWHHNTARYRCPAMTRRCSITNLASAWPTTCSELARRCCARVSPYSTTKFPPASERPRRRASGFVRIYNGGYHRDIRRSIAPLPLRRSPRESEPSTAMRVLFHRLAWPRMEQLSMA